MDLKNIISISGKSGLFKIIAQSKNNMIVESLEDKKRIPAYTTNRISALEEISIYTHDEDVSLKNILNLIFEKEKGGMTISHKDDEKKLKSYLLEILPNYDQDRVYVSDIKKIFQWYNILHKAGELKIEKELKAEKKTSGSKKEKEKAISSTDKAAKKEKKVVKSIPKKTDKVASTKSSPKPITAKKVTTVKTGTSRGK